MKSTKRFVRISQNASLKQSNDLCNNLQLQEYKYDKQKMLFQVKRLLALSYTMGEGEHKI